MSQVAPTSTSDEGGFTLAEMLVALALFALLATLLFSNVRFGVQAWAIGSARTEQIDQIGATHHLMRRIIANAYPLALRDDPTRVRIDFDDTKNAISLLAAAPVALRARGRFRFTISSESRGDGIDLMMTALRDLAATHSRASPARTLLLADLAQVEFAYFGAPRPGQAAEWDDTWTDLAELPKLIRLRARFRDDVRQWPELIVAPRIVADVSCSYDPFTKRCRGR